MKKKKVLIIGESDMVYIKEYVDNMLRYDHSLEFTIITFTKKRYLDFYKSKKIRLIELHYERENLNLDFFNKLVIKLLYQKFDYVHVQAVSLNALILAKMIAGKKSKMIATYWGFPKSKTEMRSVQPYLKDLYKISFVTDNLHEYFTEFYSGQYEKKCCCFDFGIGCIGTMRRLLNQSEITSIINKSKEELGFPKDRIIVAIGYCGRNDQQHIKVLESLEKLPPHILSKLYLFLHFSYSVANHGYKRQVLTKLKSFEQYGCKFNLCEEYMTGDRIAYLRYGVDAFINAETMDALSGSMLEYFFGGTLIFNPVWLRYSALVKNGVSYVQYTDFDDLTMKFEEYSDKIENIKSNRKPIWNMCSWNKLLPKWSDLYS